MRLSVQLRHELEWHNLYGWDRPSGLVTWLLGVWHPVDDGAATPYWLQRLLIWADVRLLHHRSSVLCNIAWDIDGWHGQA